MLSRAEKSEFLVELGREAARALARSGLYRQLDRRPADYPIAPLLRLLLSLSQALYSFTVWDLGEVGPNGDSFEIIVSDAAEFPETMRWRSIGFIEAMVSNAIAGEWSVISERPNASTIRFIARRR